MRLPRDLHVVAMITGRKGGAFKDTRSGRGGTRNTQQELLAEYEDSREESHDGQESRSRKSSTS